MAEIRQKCGQADQIQALCTSSQHSQESSRRQAWQIQFQQTSQEVGSLFQQIHGMSCIENITEILSKQTSQCYQK